jgi:hypothetical protein
MFTTTYLNNIFIYFKNIRDYKIYIYNNIKIIKYLFFS